MKLGAWPDSLRLRLFAGTLAWMLISIALVVLALILSALPWSGRSHAKDDPEYDEFLSKEEYEPDAETSAIPLIDTTTKGAGA